MSQEEPNPGMFKLLDSAVTTPDWLTGGMDLLSEYGLKSAYEALCTMPIPDAIDNSSYFGSIVGDTTIRKGDGMELMQLVGRPTTRAPGSSQIRPFDLSMLRGALDFKETTPPVILPESEKGVAIACIRSEDKVVEKSDEKKHKKSKKRKHGHNDKHKDKGKDKGEAVNSKKKHVATDGDDVSKKHNKKKRKHQTDDSAKI